MARSLTALVLRAQKTLKLTQMQLGDLVGCSERTVQRWGKSGAPGKIYVTALIPHVHTADASLAAELARAVDETLESLGVLKPAPPLGPAPPPAPEPPRPIAPPPLLLADTIACAGADAAELAPSLVRPILLAAFSRARELGVSVEAVEKALEARVRPPARRQE